MNENEAANAEKLKKREEARIKRLRALKGTLSKADKIDKMQPE
jgi:hypothetical protein